MKEPDAEQEEYDDVSIGIDAGLRVASVDPVYWEGFCDAVKRLRPELWPETIRGLNERLPN